MKYFVEIGGRRREVALDEIAPDRYRITLDGETHEVDHREIAGTECSLILGGRSFRLAVESQGNGRWLVSDGRQPISVLVQDEREAIESEILDRKQSIGGGATVKSIMPGIVREVRVAGGDAVAEGAPILILEAMKMENEVRAPAAGRVKRILVRTGDAVAAGQDLFEIE